MVLEMCYKASHNMLSRQGRESSANRRLLEKQERIESIADNIKRSEEDPQKLDEQLQELQEMVSWKYSKKGNKGLSFQTKVCQRKCSFIFYSPNSAQLSFAALSAGDRPGPLRAHVPRQASPRLRPDRRHRPRPGHVPGALRASNVTTAAHVLYGSSLYNFCDNRKLSV